MRRSDALAALGYQHGVLDQNDGLEPITRDEEQATKLGELYIENYWRGYADAKNKSWYVVSLKEVDKKFNISAWYIAGKDGKMNEWTIDKCYATKYPTLKAVREKVSELGNTLGRGTYTFTWE